MPKSPKHPFQAYSIPEFCDAHRISRGSFYNLQKEGLAPLTFRVGKRVLISEEAAAEWRTPAYASALLEIGLLLFVMSLALNLLARLLVWSVARRNADPLKLAAPTAVLDGPSRAGIGEKVVFDASKSKDVRGRALTFRWDIGGKTYDGPRVEHTFDKPGFYRVGVTATNGYLANLAYGVTTGLDVQTSTNDYLAYTDLVDAGRVRDIDHVGHVEERGVAIRHAAIEREQRLVHGSLARLLLDASKQFHRRSHPHRPVGRLQHDDALELAREPADAVRLRAEHAHHLHQRPGADPRSGGRDRSAPPRESSPRPEPPPPTWRHSIPAPRAASK